MTYFRDDCHYVKKEDKSAIFFQDIAVPRKLQFDC